LSRFHAMRAMGTLFPASVATPSPKASITQAMAA
jgi:hypothetical protein